MIKASDAITLLISLGALLAGTVFQFSGLYSSGVLLLTISVAVSAYFIKNYQEKHLGIKVVLSVCSSMVLPA